MQVPYPTDQASQMPHKFTLANDDNSYSQTLSLASDAQAGDADGTSVVTFKGMTESHTYTLQCDDGSGSAPYVMFQEVDYDTMISKLSANGGAPPPSSNATGAGAGGGTDSGATS